MKPLITIIIPVYNAEDFISEAIESIINQNINFDNLELIIIDDKSTDNSRKIIEKYSNKYSNIKPFFLEKNSGYPGKPRNIGIQNANADYIMFCDADDFYCEDLCKTLYDYILKYDAEFVSSRYTVLNNKKETLNNSFLDNYDEIMVFNSIEEFPEIIYTAANLPILIKIYKKSFLLKNQIYFEEKYFGEDFLFSLETYIKSKKFVLLNKYSGYVYRINENSVTHRKNKNNKTEFINSTISVLYRAQDLFERENFKHEDCLFENLILCTSSFFKDDFNLDDKKEILKEFQPFYKKYHITNNLVNLPLYFNIIINIAVKLFSINIYFPLILHNIYHKIKS